TQSALLKENFTDAAVEFTIEFAQRRMVGKSGEPFASAGLEIIHELRENLYGESRFPALLVQVRGIAVDVFVAVLVVSESELTDAAVVDDPGACQDVVAVPIEPRENVLSFKLSREAGKRTGDFFEHAAI